MIAHLGLNHKTAPVAVREKFAFNAQDCCLTLERLRQEGLAEEGVLLSTCNRVELYIAGATVSADSMQPLLQFLAEARSIPYTDELSKSFYYRTGAETVQHLFEVISGLDSMALGETEISGQVKNAYNLALKHQFTGRYLNKVFQDAFRTAKQIRSKTDIQRGHISVANVAVDLAEKIFEKFLCHQVVVIGAGDTSEKMAKAILSREPTTQISIVNRTLEHSQALAAKLGGRAVEFATWTDQIRDADIILSSTSAPDYVLTLPQIQSYMQSRAHHPLLLIDIAVPRDIDPAIDALENVYLYNIDDLQEIANESRRLREKQIAVCRQMVEDRVHEFMEAMRKAKEYLSRGKEQRSHLAEQNRIRNSSNEEAASAK